MTRASHSLVGLALGVGTIAVLGSAPGLLVGLGIIAGANLPDDLELPRRPDAFGNPRPPVIPHRTVTHWPWSYAIVMLALVAWRAPIALVGVGLALGALAHLLCDCASPHGIPWLSPFRSVRPNQAVYSTGRAAELLVVVPLLLLAGVAVALRWSTYSAIAHGILALVMHPLAR